MNEDPCSQWLFGPEKILSTIDPPPGVPGVSKNHIFFPQMKVFSFCAKIAPKRHKLKKPIKIEEKMSKKPCFLGLFQIFFNLGAILAHQTSTGTFSGSWPIFWHPWDPWSCVNSGDARVLRFDLIILWWWHRLADFSLFHLYENVAQCQLYNQGQMFLSVLIATIS